MLQKLRSRHPVDVPAEGFGTKKGILAVLGGLLLLFVLVPLLLALVAALGLDRGVLLAIGVAFALVVVVLALGAARGKPGWERR